MIKENILVEFTWAVYDYLNLAEGFAHSGRPAANLNYLRTLLERARAADRINEAALTLEEKCAWRCVINAQIESGDSSDGLNYITSFKELEDEFNFVMDEEIKEKIYLALQGREEITLLLKDARSFDVTIATNYAPQYEGYREEEEE